MLGMTNQGLAFDMIKDVLRNVDALIKTAQGSKPGTEIKEAL
jgi:hypothetical protein